MNRAIILAVVLSSLMVSAFAKSPPTPVEEIDLTKYVGSWFQIADFPQFYERLECTSCVKATYTLNSQGTLDVANNAKAKISFLQKLCKVTGTAYIPNPYKPAELKIKFSFGVTGSYWVIGLGPVNSEGMYSWALVSDPNRLTLYILSRTPQLEDSTLNEIKAIAKDQDFDISKLRVTDQQKCLNTQ